MTLAPTITARLLVCGNLDRCDDGAAIVAAEALLPSLREQGRRRVDVRRCGQLDIEDLLDVPPDTPLLIVDTAVGVPAGTIVTRTFDQLVDQPHGPAPHSSHALPIAQVVGVARQLADVPIDGLFVGIGGADFGFGESLSAPVRAALPEFIAAIGAAIGGLTDMPVERS
jgi:hydrogenase maturation protease